ncbi:MAG: O-antigen ligase family protein [Xanthomonadales bacterium]|nr:O-antigen ligase family protein [Xanthomonadales bacterium]
MQAIALTEIGHRLDARRWWPAMLVWAVLALLPFARLSALPMAAMAMIGLFYLATRWRSLLGETSVRLFLLFFGCYWIPATLSAVDAVEPARSWQSVAAYLRFLPVGVFCLVHLRDPGQRQWLWSASALLVALWCGDALVQAAFGVNLLGMPHSADRLNGIFGADNIKLGHVIAVLSPLVLEYVRRRWGLPVFGAAYGLMLAVIVLVGTRSGWLMYGLITLGYIYLYARGRPRRWLQAGVLVAIAASAIALAGYQFSPTLAGRIDRSLLVFQGDSESVDQALGMRLPIWQAAARMIQEHPVNGVGVRGFRYAYPGFAGSEDPWMRNQAETGAAHAHQLVLELLTETGIIGLLGFALAVWLAISHWRSLSPNAKSAAVPFALALGVMVFPVNTHLAFYSTFWSLLCWWLVMLYCASAGDQRER